MVGIGYCRGWGFPIWTGVDEPVMSGAGRWSRQLQAAVARRRTRDVVRVVVPYQADLAPRLIRRLPLPVVPTCSADARECELGQVLP